MVKNTQKRALKNRQKWGLYKKRGVHTENRGVYIVVQKRFGIARKYTLICY